MEILKTARDNARSMDIYKAKLEICNAKLEAHQKLIASYGTERVSGGKATNIIEDAVIKAERNKIFYEKRIEQLQKIRDRADTVIYAMPKKWWKVARMYYVKGYTTRQILAKKRWTSKTSIYKQLTCLDRYMREYFDK